MESEKERLKLCGEYCTKDEKGKPLINGQQYQMDEERIDEFNKKLEVLREKHKDAIEEADKRQKEFKELLEEEITVKLNTFKMSEMPKEMMGREVDVLCDLIIDDNKEEEKKQ